MRWNEIKSLWLARMGEQRALAETQRSRSKQNLQRRKYFDCTESFRSQRTVAFCLHLRPCALPPLAQITVAPQKITGDTCSEMPSELQEEADRAIWLNLVRNLPFLRDARI